MHQLTHPTFPSDLDGKDKRNRAGRPRRSRSLPVSLDQKRALGSGLLPRKAKAEAKGSQPAGAKAEVNKNYAVRRLVASTAPPPPLCSPDRVARDHGDLQLPHHRPVYLRLNFFCHGLVAPVRR